VVVRAIRVISLSMGVAVSPVLPLLLSSIPRVIKWAKIT